MDEEENISEQQTSFKGGGEGRYDNGARKLHLYFTAGSTTLSPLSPYAYLLMLTSG